MGFFHQAGHYLQQSRIDYRHSAGSLSQALNLHLDRRPALGKISDDMAWVFQVFAVTVGGSECYRSCAHEAVAVAGVTRRHPEDRAANDLPTVQHHQPVHRPDKLRTPRPPAHHFGYWQRSQSVFDTFRHEVTGERPGLRCPVHEPRALVCFILNQLVNAHPARSRKTGCRSSW